MWFTLFLSNKLHLIFIEKMDIDQILKGSKVDTDKDVLPLSAMNCLFDDLPLDK